MVPNATTMETTAALYAAVLAAALACGAAPACAAADVADMDITELVNVRVSPFDVASHLDRGIVGGGPLGPVRLLRPLGARQPCQSLSKRGCLAVHMPQ